LPAAFLGAAEEAGLAPHLTGLVLDAACATARRMREAGFTVPVSVNLSRRQLLDGDVVARLRAAIGPDLASALQVEVGEPVLAGDDPRVDATLGALAALGVAVVVADVGRGVSSLGALARVRPRMVKIDAALTRDLPGSQEASAIVSAIVALAKIVGAQVTAEGIETDAQARALRALGCEALQGYYYGHALPADEWIAYLRWACTAVVGTDGPTALRSVSTPGSNTRRERRGMPKMPGAIIAGSRVVVGRFRS
jgi:EAL domain-containing protein (putative c-di-GMP-specific phosphodiesterase class I)